MSAIEVEKKKRAANSPLQGNGKEFKESNINTSPQFKTGALVEACEAYTVAAGVALAASVLPVSPAPPILPSSKTYAGVTSASLGLATTTVVTASGSTLTTTVSTASTHSGYSSTTGADRSIFKTVKPQGSFRDEIIVEINTIDEEPFRGTVTITEAVKRIFVEALGFDKTALGSVNIGFSMGRIVTFKLKDQFDIDQLASIEEFNFKRQHQRRDGMITEQILGCKIRGIRKVRTIDQATYVQDTARWVKIEGCEYRISKEELRNWMDKLGNVITEITEDRVNLDSESDSDEGEIGEGYTVGTGTYSVKMRLHTDLPQFVPICGKRIRLYYRGITKLCTNCFGPHLRRNCESPRVQWVEYVSDFMTRHEHIPEDFYGKWTKIVKDWRLSNAAGNSDKPPVEPAPSISNVQNEQLLRSNNETTLNENSPATNQVRSSLIRSPGTEPDQNPNCHAVSNTSLDVVANSSRTECMNETGGPLKLRFTQPQLQSMGFNYTSSTVRNHEAASNLSQIPPFGQKKSKDKSNQKRMSGRKASI